MILYTQQGGALTCTAASWLELLSIARKTGWKPAGTLPPAGEFDIDVPPSDTPWAGEYFPAQRQIMRAEDAAGLGSALGLALKKKKRSGTTSDDDVQKIVEFLDRGPLLICPDETSEGEDRVLVLHRHQPVEEADGEARPHVVRYGRSK